MSKRTKLTLKQKKAQNSDPSEKSVFQRKKEFLAENGGRGEDYPDKPWR